MGRMNWSRILFGGLVAGMIINGFDFLARLSLLKGAWEKVNGYGNPKELVGQPFAPQALCSVLIGVVAVWIYAAILPRFGRGMKTVLLATIATWLPGYCAALLPWLARNVLPPTLVLGIIAVGFLGVWLGLIASGWLYRDVRQSEPGSIAPLALAASVEQTGAAR